MRGVIFVNSSTSDVRDTAYNWGLVMSKKVIGTPAVKEKIIDLADRDGVLDFTESLTGVPAYETRELSFTFEYLDAIENWTEISTDIRNVLHGRRLLIVEPDDMDYYYMGRVSVGEPSSGRVKIFTVTVRADTWKYPMGGETSVSETVTASKKVVLKNSWKPVCPTITTTGAVTFEFNGVRYSIAGAGTFRFPKFRLSYGDNTVTLVSGSGKITFTYQEGAI